MQRVTPITGFPEWLPQQRMLEMRLMRDLGQLFELHGFAPLETRAVELVETLAAKGEVEKEIYTLRRLQEDGSAGDAKLALHFDLTVPLARYVVEREHELSFPFKRYQMQRVWRGERPQQGRFREFYQVDIDILADDVLPGCFEAEAARVLLRAFQIAPMPAMQLHVSNRQIMDGVCQSLGLSNALAVLPAVDKLAKIGPERVRALLQETAGLSADQASLCLAVAALRGDAESVRTQVLARVPTPHPTLLAGLDALAELLGQVRDAGFANIIADLGIVRGLDYYTGVVYEGYLLDSPQLGAICSGGRYDNLTAQLGRSKPMPGVGVSIGLTRIMAHLFSDPALSLPHKSPTQVVVALLDEARRPESEAWATQLRTRGIPCEVFHAPQKFAKQIRYASRKGIPYVLFPEADPTAPPQMRTLSTGTQGPVDLATWVPEAGPAA